MAQIALDFPDRRLSPIRTILFLLSMLLILSSVWLVATESFNSLLPKQSDKSKISTDMLRNAGNAARIGWPRGDVASHYAVLLSKSVSAPDEAAIAISELQLALAKSPSSSVAWLMLGRLLADSTQKPEAAKSAISMSFFTAPNDKSLFAERLILASRSVKQGDEELQTLIDHDVRAIERRAPDLLWAVKQALSVGTSEAREVIRKATSDTMPSRR